MYSLTFVWMAFQDDMTHMKREERGQQHEQHAYAVHANGVVHVPGGYPAALSPRTACCEWSCRSW